MSTLSSCPVCSKEFPVKTIENHVEKCLFLTSEAGTSKRSSDDISVSTPKRIKANNVETPKNFVESTAPLSEKMRPTQLEDFIGQEHILSENKPLRNLLENDKIPSMILWGPPGCGKTSLAHIIQNRLQALEIRFIKLSATQAGVNDIKDIIKVAKNEIKLTKRKTILFMDEIHRFNKLQQDIFLPNVENGLITLIGATTENPSFSLNSALLSRCKVFIFEKLKTKEIEKMLIYAAKKVEAYVPNCNEISNPNFKVTKETLTWLAEICDGDARIALNSFQMALESTKGNEILLNDIKEGIKKSHLLYDRKGEEHYNIISALHKSIRASDDNAAIYWLTRMLEGGEDPIFIARRLVRAASEDIGLANPLALSVAVSAMQGCQLIGMPECDVILAQTAVFLARSNKSQETYRALLKAKDCIKNHSGPLPSVPLHLRNAPTKLMRDIGYGKGYNMAHMDESGLNYMPEGMESVSFFPEDEEHSV